MPGRAARSRRQTSMPSSRGSIRSSTTRSNGSRSPVSTPASAVADRRDLVAVARRADRRCPRAGWLRLRPRGCARRHCVTRPRRACKGRVRPIYSAAMRRVCARVRLRWRSPATSRSADPTQLGGFFGPRIFSGDSRARLHRRRAVPPDARTTRSSFGVRVAQAVRVPVARSRSSSSSSCRRSTHRLRRHGARRSASVVWIEPRVAAALRAACRKRRSSRSGVGGGAPIALSSARKTFNTGIIGEGYLGGGVRFDTHKGFVAALRCALRVLPGGRATSSIAFEGDVTLGLELELGAHARRSARREVVAAGPPPDTDDDGIPDTDDKCPDRAEDMDDFEDADGCPDIDNDDDRVLDIADKCPTEPENLNGFEDDDGCPDTVPPEVDGAARHVEGLHLRRGRDRRSRLRAEVAREDREGDGRAPVDQDRAHRSHRRSRGQGVRRAAREGQPAARHRRRSRPTSHARAPRPCARRSSRSACAGPHRRRRRRRRGAGRRQRTAKGRLANRRVEIKLFVAP